VKKSNFEQHLQNMEEQSTVGKKKSICVILAYNCGSVLENTYKRIPVDSVDRIVLIDDASTDDTLVVAKRLGIEYYTHPNLGYGGNVKYSIRKCIELGAEYIVELHGDGQYDPTAIPSALTKAREGYDLVLGSRFFDLKQPLKDEMSFARYFANIGLSFIERLVLGLKVTEFHTGFRVYTKHLAETVLLDNTSDDFLFGFEVIVQAHFCKLKIGEIAVRGSYKEEHTSISIPKSIIYAFQTFKVLALYLLAKAGTQTKLFGGQSRSKIAEFVSQK
jgi:glycosyltransferase involved in cell wall biosynthesis